MNRLITILSLSLAATLAACAAPQAESRDPVAFAAAPHAPPQVRSVVKVAHVTTLATSAKEPVRLISDRMRRAQK